MSDLAKTIDDAFEQRNDVSPSTTGAVREAVDEALEMLDRGDKRVAEKQNGKWQVNQWLKKAVLLSFRLNDMSPIRGPGGANWGKGAVEIRGLGREPLPRGRLLRAGRRAPLRLHRAERGADAELVTSAPSRPGTMVDTWATVGRARRSARTCTSRAAPASAACLSPA